MRVIELLQQASERLPGDESRCEAELLLMHASQQSRTWLIMHATHVLDEQIVQRFERLVSERLSGKPIAYILGTQGFWSLDLLVNKHTLIPRAETELLVECALEKLKDKVAAHVLDLGTGSGAIALAIAKEKPATKVLAVDQSADALQIAIANAERNQISNAKFLRSNWFDALGQTQQFDIIVSNPPYVAVGDPHLQQGDLRFEPAAALSSGADGLDDIRHIIRHAPRFLNAGGWLMFEHGLDQASSVSELLSAARFIEVRTRQDLEQRDRVTMGCWQG